MCIAGNPPNCSNSDGDEYEYLCQSLKYSYNYHMDDCNGKMTLGLAVVSYMSIFNDFNKPVTYGRDIFHGRIMDDFSMITVDSTTAENHESTFGTDTNGFGDDTGGKTNLYSGQVMEPLDCLSIPLILITLLPTLVILILTINPVFRMN